MAEDEKQVDDEDEGKDKKAEAPKGGRLVLLIGLLNTVGLLVIGAIVIMGGGGAPQMPMMSPEMAAGTSLDNTMPPVEMGKGGPGPMVELGTITVNLKEPTGDRYLKTKINLELDSEGTRAEVEGRLSQIRYQLTMLLSGQRVADVTGPEAMESLRKSMVRRANATMGGKGRIINAWPEEWIVQ